MIVDAEFDLICWRKGDFEPLVDTDFTEHSFTDADIGVERAYTLAETTTELDCGKHGGLSLRQIHKRGRDGSQHPLVTSRRDLPAAESSGGSAAVGATRTTSGTGERISRSTRSTTTPTNLTTQPGWCPTPPRPTPPPR